MEASALPGSVGLARPRIGLGVPLLRLRSDEQLVSLFRSGNEEAFRVIHDRYRQRLHAYSRQMLSGSVADAEDVVQDIFVRAYGGLRSSDRELALRAWLYRIAHNRCIDEVRRPQPIVTDAIEEMTATSALDPMARIEQRDALRRLIADVRRLPEQQRSALLMRELGGMTYADVAQALAVSVPAVKSLLVRARVGLAQAGEARDTSCARIREDVIVSHDRGVRTSGLARRHMRDCPDCRQFRTEVRGVSRRFAALLPAVGPVGVVAKVLGIGGAGGGGAAAGTGAVAGTGAAAGGGAVSVGAVAGAGHVVTLIAAAVVTAGGAIELQRMSPPPAHRVQHHHIVRAATALPKPRTEVAQVVGSAAAAAAARGNPSAGSTPPAATAQSASPVTTSAVPGTASTPRLTRSVRTPHPLPISEVVDPDNLNTNPAVNTTSTTTPSTTPAPTTTTTTTGVPGTATSTTPSTTTPSATASTGTGLPSTGASTTPSTTTPAGATTTATAGSGTEQPPTAVTPLTKTSRTSATSSGSAGSVALGATGASTRPGSVRVYKSTRR